MLPKHDFLEIHRSKISLHRAQTRDSYSTIHLSHTFKKLAGLPTYIYDTIYRVALAFLVAVSTSATAGNCTEIPENAEIDPKFPVLTWQRSRIRILSSPSFFLQSDTKIMAEDQHDSDEEDPLLDAFRRGIVKSYLQIQDDTLTATDPKK